MSETSKSFFTVAFNSRHKATSWHTHLRGVSQTAMKIDLQR